MVVSSNNFWKLSWNLKQLFPSCVINNLQTWLKFSWIDFPFFAKNASLIGRSKFEHVFLPSRERAIASHDANNARFENTLLSMLHHVSELFSSLNRNILINVIAYGSVCFAERNLVWFWSGILIFSLLFYNFARPWGLHWNLKQWSPIFVINSLRKSKA